MIDASLLPAIRSRLCESLAPPCERYRPLRVDDRTVGWLDDARAARLAMFGDAFTVRDHSVTFNERLHTERQRTEVLEHVTRTLAADGLLSAWRNEHYAVRVNFTAAPLFMLERAAARFFGITTYAAHVNGLVFGDDDEPEMWLARRSPTKAIDPGLLDNLVGGGIAAHAGVMATLIKEAWEEAGIEAPLARLAQSAGAVHICRTQADGLQRETIFVHDLALPPEFTPVSKDDEVVEYRRVTLAEAARLIANTAGNNVVTADASLVIVDCLLRRAMIAPDADDYLALEALRHPPLEPEADNM